MAGIQKQVGLIGVGNMGRNIAQNLHSQGYSLVLYNKTEDSYAPFRGKEGITIADSVEDLAGRVSSGAGSAIVWMMVPPGKETNDTVSRLSGIMRNGDIVIDASNSEYTDSMSNYGTMKRNGIHYLDVGCAGGPDDLLAGVSLMAGGDREAFDTAEDVLKVVCKNGKYGYVGPPGAGHMSKLAHNMIFYGIFPVMAEGVELLDTMSKSKLNGKLDMREALRLFAAAPPITTGIPAAIGKAIEKGLPKEAPEVALSPMVKFGLKEAGEMHVGLPVINSILGAYSSMSEGTRRVYYAAKRILTGH